MRHWHSLARKIWLEDAKEMAQFARSIQLPKLKANTRWHEVILLRKCP